MPRGDRLIRLAQVLSVIVLAAAAGYVSFRHCYGLALHLGEDRKSALILPVTVDGLLISAALVGLFCSRYGLPQPRLARFALGLGIAATVACNVASGISAGIFSAALAGWPAISLLIATELMLWTIATARSMETRQVVIVEHEEPVSADSPIARVTRTLAAEPELSAAEIARRTGVAYWKVLPLVRAARERMTPTV